MSRIYSAVLAACLLLSGSAAVLAQTHHYGQSESTQLGVFWDYNVNQHRVGFQSLEGIPNCCQEFEDAIGTGFTAGAVFNMQLSSLWMLSFRASYSRQDATLTNTETLFAANNGLPVDAEIEHAIDARLASVGLDALAGIRVYAGLYMHAGLRFGYSVLHEYEQKESLVKPYSYGTFENGLRERNVYSGDIPAVKEISGAVLGGISYHLPLNKQGSATLSPELYYGWYLTPVATDLDWYADAIQIGLALTIRIGGGGDPRIPEDGGRSEYERWQQEQRRTEPSPRSGYDADTPVVPEGNTETPQGGVEPLPGGDLGRHYEDDIDENGALSTIPPEMKDTMSVQSDTETDVLPEEQAEEASEPNNVPEVLLETEKTEIPADVIPAGISRDGEEHVIQEVSAEEFGITDVVTLLNYVFFSKESSQIPSRYALLTPEQAKEFRIRNLDAAGLMGQHYQVLNIIGSRLRDYPDAEVTIVGCNDNTGEEEGRLDLSRRRAETVRDYLRDVWGIDARRITLKSRNLPEFPSKEETPEAAEENRRVELYSSTWEILRPLVWNKTEWHATPSAIRFRLPEASDEDIATWRFSITQEGDVVKEYTGNNTVPESLEWNVTNEQPFRTGSAAPWEYTLQIVREDGDATTRTSGSLPVRLLSVQDKQIARQPDKEYTRYQLLPFEEEAGNSEDYQKQVTGMVTSIFGSDADITVFGPPSAEPESDTYPDSALRMTPGGMRIDTALPEGRFFTRVVRVLVEMPVAGR